MPGKNRPKLGSQSHEVKTTRDRNNVDHVYFEKSVTHHIGDNNYAKITVGVSSQLNPSEEDVEQIKKTIEVLDGVVTEEVEYQIKETLK